MSKYANRQVGQRIISGVLATLGVLAITMQLVLGKYDGWSQAALGIAGLVGCYLFGYFALRGQLPGSHLPKASAAIKQATSHHDL